MGFYGMLSIGFLHGFCMMGFYGNLLVSTEMSLLGSYGGGGLC